MKPNEFTYGIVLRKCAELAAPHQGKQFSQGVCQPDNLKNKRKASAHAYHQMSISHWNALVHMHVKCPIKEYDLKPNYHMQWQSSLKLVQFSFPSGLSTCVVQEDLEWSTQLNVEVVKIGFELDIIVLCLKLFLIGSMWWQVIPLSDPNINHSYLSYVLTVKSRFLPNVFLPDVRTLIGNDDLVFLLRLLKGSGIEVVQSCENQFFLLRSLSFLWNDAPDAVVRLAWSSATYVDILFNCV
eukprot:Gb_26107 [translate_table: standard]